MPKISRSLIIWLIVLAVVIIVFFTLISPSPKSVSLPSSELISDLQQGRDPAGGNFTAPVEVTIKDTSLTTEINGTTYTTNVPSDFDAFQAFAPQIADGTVTVNYQGSSRWGSIGTILLTFLPWILFGALIIFMLRQAQGGSNQALSFGRSRARMVSGDKPTVTFGDVAGVDEAKQELQEVVEFLKYPEKFIALGARIPRGVLLVGPPGTGKTLLARAVAGEAGVPFFSISGSEFVEMFVGVGASRVRDLFDQAKRNAPCIIFVDEIDAVGRHRGSGLGGGHDEREQTLNQILVEMDGFDSSTKVIVISATNRPDILDPALLRPGRFDRRVVLDQPDINGRKAILQVHIKGKPLETDVDLEVIAKQTPGFSGADLANVVNEGALLAARRNKKKIGLSELEEAIDRVLLGPERKSRVISMKEKEIIAYHEAGHALVARNLPKADPVHKISVVARGMAGGYTKQLPTEDRRLHSVSQLRDMLTTLMGGRAAEELIFGRAEVTTGAQSDLEQATDIARGMVKRYAMSDEPRYEEMAISAVIAEILADNIKSIEVYGDDLLVQTKDDRIFQSRKESDFSLVEFLREQGINTSSDGVQVIVKDSASLGGLGLRTFGRREELVFLGRMVDEQQDYGDKVADAIDAEIKSLVEDAYARAKDILNKNRPKLVQIAQRLVAEETLEGEKLETLFKEPVPPSTPAAGSAEGTQKPDTEKGDSTGKAAVNLADY
jgi:cell division protease FtsH